MPEVAQIVAEGSTRSTVRLRSGLQADLHVVEPKSFGAALHLTGGKAHSIALRTRGLRRGLRLSEYGVFDRRGRRKGGETEESGSSNMSSTFAGSRAATRCCSPASRWTSFRAAPSIFRWMHWRGCNAWSPAFTRISTIVQTG